MIARFLAWLETRKGFFVAVASISGVMALLRLVRITFPASRVFDEVYSPQFAWDFLHGKAFFDVHPILAEFQHIPGLLLFGDIPLGWRISAWFWGIVFAWAAAFVGWMLTGRRLGGVLACLIVSLDTAYFIYGRTGLPDMFLLANLALALACFFGSARVRHRGWAALIAVLSGVFMGNVVASKWLGLAIVGSVGLWIVLQLCRKFSVILRQSRGIPSRSFANAQDDSRRESLCLLPRIPWWLYPICFLLIPALTYALWLIPLLRTTTVGEPVHSVGTAWALVKEWHRQVWNYHAHLTATHPYGSRWWEWPILRHPVLFFYETEAAGRRVINASGNIVLWWSGFIAFVSAGAWVIYQFFVSVGKIVLKGSRQPHFAKASRGGQAVVGSRPTTYWLLPTGWLVLSTLLFWLPWARINRVSFNYHYFVPFFFEVLLLTVFLLWLLDRPKDRAYAVAFLVLAIVGFIALYPSATGLLIPNSITNIRWLFP
jgi:dolichyl-phosphate-mannose-protein mannosyltransferase